jgi:hypothetical protein
VWGGSIPIACVVCHKTKKREGRVKKGQSRDGLLCIGSKAKPKTKKKERRPQVGRVQRDKAKCMRTSVLISFVCFFVVVVVVFLLVESLSHPVDNNSRDPACFSLQHTCKDPSYIHTQRIIQLSYRSFKWKKSTLSLRTSRLVASRSSQPTPPPSSLLSTLTPQQKNPKKKKGTSSASSHQHHHPSPPSASLRAWRCYTTPGRSPSRASPPASAPSTT